MNKTEKKNNTKPTELDMLIDLLEMERLARHRENHPDGKIYTTGIFKDGDDWYAYTATRSADPSQKPKS